MLWWLGTLEALRLRSLVAAEPIFCPSWPQAFRSDFPDRASLPRSNPWFREWRVAQDDRSATGEAQGDRFSTLFAQHEADVLRVCRRMLGANHAAEDAASEVYLRARRAFASYDASRPFRPWLLSVAGNLCIDQLRRRKTESRLFDDSDLAAGDLTHPGPSPLRQALRNEQRSEIADALDALDEKYRLPLMLRYFSELDYQAIGEVIGVSRNQVGTLLLRAKRQLRGALEKGGDS